MGGASLDRPQSLLDSYLKKMGPHEPKCQNLPRVQEHSSELSFLHFSGRGNWFSEGHQSDLPKMEARALHFITLFSDKHKENGLCLYIFTPFWENQMDGLQKTSCHDLENEGN